MISRAPCAAHSSFSPALKPGQRGDRTHVARGGLGDHARDLAAALGERGAHGVEVVVGQHDRVGGLRSGDARAGGQAERRDPRSGLGEQGVDVAVVAARELDDPGAPGDPAGEPDGAHRRLRARVDQPHLLHRPDPPDDLLSELDLGRRRRAERQPAARRLPDRFDDRRVRVAEDHRAPRADQVDVAVAVGVGEPRPPGGDHEPRRPADGGEGADGRVDPTGDRGGGAGEQGAGGCGVEFGGAEFGEGGRAHGPSLPQRTVCPQPTRRAAGRARCRRPTQAACSGPAASVSGGGRTSRGRPRRTSARAPPARRPAGPREPARSPRPAPAPATRRRARTRPP